MALETVFSFLDIGWSLSGKDAGNMYSISGGRANTIKMRDKPSSNCSISEVAFHHAKLALSVVLPFVKLNTLAFYRLELTLMCSVSIDISDNARDFEIYDGVVDKESGSGGRVEDVEVVIFDPRTIEIGRRVCTCMKGNGVLGVTLLANSYDVSINSNLSESDISRYFILSILVEENKWVLSHITTIVLAPSRTWMVWIVQLYGKLGNVGDGTGCGGKGDSGVIRSESDWFFTLNIFI